MATVRERVAGHIAVHRLWPWPLYPQDRFELSADQAAAAIAAGLVFPVLPDGATVAGGPLATMIRSRLEGDGELTGLLATATAYARRSRNSSLMRYVASLLPRQLRPSDFTPEQFRAEHGERAEGGWYSRPPEWTNGVRDPRALCLAHHLGRRRDEVVVDLFECIRHDRLG